MVTRMQFFNTLLPSFCASIKPGIINNATRNNKSYNDNKAANNWKFRFHFYLAFDHTDKQIDKFTHNGGFKRAFKKVALRGLFVVGCLLWVVCCGVFVVGVVCCGVFVVGCLLWVVCCGVFVCVVCCGLGCLCVYKTNSHNPTKPPTEPTPYKMLPNELSPYEISKTSNNPL